MAELSLGARKLGPGHPMLVIAEVAQAHEGSVNLAHSFIDNAADAGADAIKFQTHIADAESSHLEQWRIKFSKQDKSRFDYWKRMEFAPEYWAGLKEHAEKRGLVFLSSPFSTRAVDLLSSLGIVAWKVASGEVRNEAIIDALIKTGLPTLLSSGMSPWSDLDPAVKSFKDAGIPLLLMQCTTAYPCPPERIGLNVLNELSDRYSCEIGLSDHSGTIWPSISACLLGARAVEVHVTWDRTMFGPDAPASVTFKELKQMVEGIRFIERMVANPVNKDAEARGMQPLRDIFGQSLVAAINIQAGTTLEPKHLSTKKPLAGIPASEYKATLGARVRRNIQAGEFIQRSDIE